MWIAAAFLFGFCTAIVVILVILIWFFRRIAHEQANANPLLPSPSINLSQKIAPATSFNFEPPLTGWIRLCTTYKPGSLEHAVPLSMSRMFQTRSDGVVTISDLPAGYYYASINDGRIDLFQDSQVSRLVGVIELKRSPGQDLNSEDGAVVVVDFVPEDLLNFEMFSKDFPLRLRRPHIRSVSPSSDLTLNMSLIAKSPILYLYNCNSIEKEDWYVRILAETGVIRSDDIHHHSSLDPSTSNLPTATTPAAPPNPIFAHASSSYTSIPPRSANSSNSDFKLAPSPAMPNDSKWFSAFLGRVYSMESVRTTIIRHLYSVFEQKIRRATKSANSYSVNSSYLGNIRLSSVDLADMPRLSRFQLLSNEMFEREGLRCDFAIEFDGPFSIAIESDLQLDALVTTVTVPLACTIRIGNISGKAQLFIKPKPSNRIWFGFHAPGPKYTLDVIPQLSTASMRLSLITDFVRTQLETVLQEFLVLPNMDDFALDDDFMLDFGRNEELLLLPLNEFEPEDADGMSSSYNIDSSARMYDRSQIQPSPRNRKSANASPNIFRKNPATRQVHRMKSSTSLLTGDSRSSSVVGDRVASSSESASLILECEQIPHPLGLQDIVTLRSRKSVDYSHR